MAGLSKEQAAEDRRRFAQLVERPAEDSRAAAVRQRDALAKKLDGVILVGPIGRGFRDDLFGVDKSIRYGDELRDDQGEKERIQRRRFYARAYLMALDSAVRLDKEYADTLPAVLAIQEAFAWLGSAAEGAGEVAGEAAKDAGKALVKVGEGVRDVVREVGSTAQNTVYLLAGGLGLAAVAYAYAQGRSRRRSYAAR